MTSTVAISDESVAKVTKAISSGATENGVVVPTPETRVFKDQCTYCFHTPFFAGGLFVCLASYECVCIRHLKAFNQLTGNNIFLQIESHKISSDGNSGKANKESEGGESDKDKDKGGEPINKISRLAIDQEKIEIKDKYSLISVVGDAVKRCELSDDLDGDLLKACQFVRDATSAERLQLLQQTGDAWDGEAKIISKHSNTLHQVEGKTVPSSGWKCEAENCDLTENLWLNLSDGSIRCGRSQYIADGKKCAGNGHMQSYYDKTRFPLSVKLGTITRNLDVADVYSYDECSNVLDTNLERHLLHFGLDPATLEKTEKSTIEMELDINQKWEWAACQEDGVNLEAKYGPGYTGLINLGNSCYMNSVIQTLLMVPEFRDRYGKDVVQLTRYMPFDVIHNDFNAQTTKLVHNMLSGDYALEGSDHNGIKPVQFKRIVAGNHPEFSTGRQQDAEEFLRYFLDKIMNHTQNGETDPGSAIRFKVEDRFEDNSSHKVRYTINEECVLRLPMNTANRDPTPDRPDRQVIQMEACFEEAFGNHDIEGYKSPVTGEVKGAKKRTRMATFPDFLVLQMEKFTLTEAGELKKKDIEVQVHETIDLSMYKAMGIQSDEELLPEGADEPIMKLPSFDPAIVQQLVDMGFSENAATKAAIEAKKANAGAENATEWIMVHMDDHDLNAPPVPVAFDPKTNKPLPSEENKAGTGGSATHQSEVNQTYLETICSLGFTEHQARYALRKHAQLEVATDWLFNNGHEVPPEEEEKRPGTEKQEHPGDTRDAQTTSRPPKTYRDGEGQYKLAGFISHIGRSPHAGHYVAHIRKEGNWVLFNDEKVALSQQPPMSLAYLYLYRRVDAPAP